MQQRGVEVVLRHFPLDGVVAELIRRAVDDAGLEPAPANQWVNP